MRQRVGIAQALLNAGADPAAGPIDSVTLRLLLAHQSGFQSEPPGTDWAVGRYEGDVAVNLARASEVGTRVPVAALFENLEDGAQVAQFVEWFPGVTIEQARVGATVPKATKSSTSRGSKRSAAG